MPATDRHVGSMAREFAVESHVCPRTRLSCLVSAVQTMISSVWSMSQGSGVPNKLERRPKERRAIVAAGIDRIMEQRQLCLP